MTALTSSEARPPRTVFHGTDDVFIHFDTTASLGAHFGTRAAATDRMRDIGIHRLTLHPYQDEDGTWWAIEHSTGNHETPRHGPFESENLAQEHCDSHTHRVPLAIELDCYRPLVMPDLGVWTFQVVTRHLQMEEAEKFSDAEKWHTAWNRSNEAGWAAVHQSLTAAGYDCIAYANATEDPGSVSWIVWDASRIHFAWTPEQAHLCEAREAGHSYPIPTP